MSPQREAHPSTPAHHFTAKVSIKRHWHHLGAPERPLLITTEHVYGDDNSPWLENNNQGCLLAHCELALTAELNKRGHPSPSRSIFMRPAPSLPALWQAAAVWLRWFKVISSHCPQSSGGIRRHLWVSGAADYLLDSDFTLIRPMFVCQTSGIWLVMPQSAWLPFWTS